MPVETCEEIQPIVLAKKQPSFVETPSVKDVIRRALLYLEAGYPVHLSGAAGTGKTTLAMYLAAQLSQPVVLIHGDEEFGTSDLVGGEYGYRKRKIVDNFIHSVLKAEEDVVARWVDNRLTVACKHGFTLLYDEFTRSRPEANNALLCVLEERMLDLPAGRGNEGYLRVHPNFRAILTSNPHEYAGVYKPQDALRDRMITIKLDHYDRQTEVAITCAKAEVSRDEAERIVDLVRAMRDHGENGATPSIRAAIMIGRILKLSGARLAASDQQFTEACQDILDSETRQTNGRGEIRSRLEKLLKQLC